jgi:uncharacterized coiled-coil DUF342 family protein
MQKKQPTTEQVLKALNEIIRENKTKLKTEKVELSMADDIKKLYSQYISLNEGLDKEYSLVYKAADNLQAWANKMDKIINNADTLYKNAEKAVNELGANRNNFGWFDDLDKIKKQSTLKDVRKAIQSLNSI